MTCIRVDRLSERPEKGGTVSHSEAVVRRYHGPTRVRRVKPCHFQWYAPIGP